MNVPSTYVTSAASYTCFALFFFDFCMCYCLPLLSGWLSTYLPDGICIHKCDCLCFVELRWISGFACVVWRRLIRLLLLTDDRVGLVLGLRLCFRFRPVVSSTCIHLSTVFLGFGKRSYASVCPFVMDFFYPIRVRSPVGYIIQVWPFFKITEIV